METFLLVMHVIITFLLVGSILLQPSESDGMASGMGGGTMGGMMTARGTANLLTRTTATLVALFFLTSLSLAVLQRGGSKATSIFEAEDQGPVTSLSEAPKTSADTSSESDDRSQTQKSQTQKSGTQKSEAGKTPHTENAKDPTKK